ncbi:aldehyde dehydrogenase family protein [Bacillus hwajinpoensis]|uniref:Aldehyde dehydrogenase n=1 Tax=Guptibacillus hwajinpoensis TaxID=208199 RepID=A0A845ETY8_9BACL|nr:aldehyde dehydrogenase family protein [Pseudalkalibacillus hwajinpoensis]MYL62143.1 aldehyde dehydrogenase family protein [Pseudalkalibacillus hwajinpoensis]
MTNQHLYINGAWQQGEGYERDLINPATAETIMKIKEASREQASTSVDAARTAFNESDWATNSKIRVIVLHKLADLLEQNEKEFAAAETENTGKPIREATLDIGDSVACLRYYANLIAERETATIEMSDGTSSKIIDEPIGVCALIVPWNFPLLLGMWKIAPALAAGNTVVFKPSELTPVTAIMLADLIHQCGFPPGVFNLVPGGGDPVGETLVAHPEVDKVSFTGGSETGKHINQQCAKDLKRVSLELGGKSPLIILEDAELESAVEWTIFGGFFNQGEVCVASSRILVHESLYEAFIDKLVYESSRIKIGDPTLEETEMGPLVSRTHLQKVKSYIDLGKEEGASVQYGGKHPDKGFYQSPVIFTNVHQSMRIVQEEIFGPVITVQSFRDQNEAIRLANGTKYGLAAGVLSTNVSQAEQVASQLKAGTIWINSYHTPYVEAPWGGYKESGIGRELGPHGLAGFTEVKHVNTSQQLQKAGWYTH